MRGPDPVTQESTWENILIWKIGLSILPETEIELNKIFMRVVYTIFSLGLLVTTALELSEASPEVNRQLVELENENGKLRFLNKL